MKSKWKNIDNIKMLNSERGSSSVLVIMIMLLLITFGVLAMMSSYSNLKIARKHADWTKGYYALENIAQKKQIDIKNTFLDTATQNKENRISVDNLMTALDFSDVEITSISHLIELGLSEEKLQQTIWLYSLYKALYESQQVTFNYDASIIKSGFDGSLVPSMSFVITDAETQRELLVSYNLPLVAESNFPEVKEWRELPKAFEYSDELEFGDPKGNE
ncbi:MAG: hypothetical protein BGO41_02075 [Clostridiales bacterium 38-18]|nr:MAG: hypothetical protein BGO41_02075 [Clostridiales bacterium 38-18]